MKTILKFELKEFGEVRINVPKNASILDVQSRKNTACIWLKVDTEAEEETRVFRIYGTGHVILEERGNDHQYVGTYQLMDGDLIFHVFEIVKNRSSME